MSNQADDLPPYLRPQEPPPPRALELPLEEIPDGPPPPPLEEQSADPYLRRSERRRHGG